MAELGYITADQAADGQEAEPIRLKLTDPPNDCVSVPEKHNDWGFFCDYFRNWWMRAARVRRATRRSARTSCAAAATRIVTTLDPKIQEIGA